MMWRPWVWRGSLEGIEVCEYWGWESGRGGGDGYEGKKCGGGAPWIRPGTLMRLVPAVRSRCIGNWIVLTATGQVGGVSWSGDSKYLVSTAQDWGVWVWDLSKREGEAGWCREVEIGKMAYLAELSLADS